MVSKIRNGNKCYNGKISLDIYNKKIAVPKETAILYCGNIIYLCYHKMMRITYKPAGNPGIPETTVAGY
ncbi:hypothetical protein C7475_106390 [Chitinophaga sp. S165]|nr:hypothetical protein C7475_106390 [Chitinophaga sp. S165]